MKTLKREEAHEFGAVVPLIGGHWSDSGTVNEPEHTMSSLMIINFFGQRQFSNEVSQKMSTNFEASQFHHILITM